VYLHIVKLVEFKNRLNDENVRKLSAVAGKLFHGAITLSEKKCFRRSMRLLCVHSLHAWPRELVEYKELVNVNM